MNRVSLQICIFAHIHNVLPVILLVPYHAGQRSRFAVYDGCLWSHLRPITAGPVRSFGVSKASAFALDRFTSRPKGQRLRAAQRQPRATLSRTLDQLGLTS